MGTCKHCGKSAKTVSDVIGYCAQCIRGHFNEVWPDIKRVHDETRRLHGLPTDPPRAADGKACPLCHHQCLIPEGGRGYCGLRRVANGRLIGGRPHEGNLSYYHDPLPTNCVADFVCPAGSDCGYPRYSVAPGPEYGYRNLAVFYQACSFNCLYCQNYHFRVRTASPDRITAEELAAAADDRTTCICYFGGDPSPQILHALKTSTLAVRNADNRVMRICWETNGAMQRPFLQRMADLSLESGGCIKFDLKAWDPGIHHALCGVPNIATIENFRWLSTLIPRRPELPLLVASTLLVPGYVDEAEVTAIATFLADLNREIPYRLLAFHPEFQLRDLPPTSKSHAECCRAAAERAGLRRISIGNLHLLGNDYTC
ncbi:MAG: radical SAM protein [Desulfomonile tiedjei]|nr:radical SAM protein [Desulfomonile tiedjei]